MTMLMKITGADGQMLVRGGCKAAGRLGWIELSGFGWNSRRPFVMSAAAASPVTEMWFTKGRDSATHWLSKRVFNQDATEFVKITVEWSNPGNTVTFVLIDVSFDGVGYSRGDVATSDYYDISFERMSTSTASVRSA